MADDLISALTAVVAVVTLPLGVLALFFVSFEVALIVFVVGWFLLTPLIPIVGEELLPALDDESGVEQADPLTELKQRYARGEIGDAEFERQVEKLVETEDVEVEGPLDVDAGGDATRDRDREVDSARE